MTFPSSWRSKGDFEGHFRLRADVASRGVRNRSEVPDDWLFGQLELERREEDAEDDLYKQTDMSNLGNTDVKGGIDTHSSRAART